MGGRKRVRKHSETMSSKLKPQKQLPEASVMLRLNRTKFPIWNFRFCTVSAVHIYFTYSIIASACVSMPHAPAPVVASAQSIAS
jgi:hypothetical protein